MSDQHPMKKNFMRALKLIKISAVGALPCFNYYFRKADDILTTCGTGKLYFFDLHQDELFIFISF